MKQRKTVLIVEDELAQAQFLKLVLTELLGFDCIVCLSYKEGLKFLGQVSIVDLVLMDVNLTDEPKLDLTKGYEGTGIDLVEKIRLQRKQLPVIYLTAYAQDRGVIKKMKQNNCYFLSKPFFEKGLREVIAYALEPVVDGDVIPLLETVKTTILLKKGIEYIDVIIRDILFVESSDGMLTAYTNINIFTSSSIRTINDFELLVQGNGFKRIIRGISINAKRLITFTYSYDTTLNESTIILFFKNNFSKKKKFKGRIVSMIEKLNLILEENNIIK